MKKSLLVLLVMALVLAPSGCGKKEPPPPPAPADDGRAAAEAEARARAEAEARARAEAEERARREAEERARLERELAASRATLEEMVFFDYDKAEIRPDARATLERKLPILRQNASVRIRIEGHCDERGSNEYNVALGSRRAQSIMAYLADAGISSSRIEVVSYGEERPRATGQNETAWQQNRRGEFRILSGFGG